MSIYQRVITACVGLTIVAIITFGVLSYQSGQRMLLDSIRARLDAVATNQHDKIEAVVAAWHDRVALIASRTQLRLSLRHYLTTGDQASLARINKIITDAQHSVRAVQSIAVGPPDGKVLAQAGPALEGAIRSLEFNNDTSDIRLAGMYLAANGTLYARFDAPMLLDGKQVGRAQVTLLADELIRAAADYTGLGDSGETLLVTEDARGQPVYLTALRHQPDSALTVVSSDPSGALQQALSGQSLLASAAIDYRSQPIMTSARVMSGTGWGVLVKMDQQEILAPVSAFQNRLLIAASVLIACAIALGLIIARAIARPVEQLAEDARRIQQGERTVRAEVEPQHAREIQLLATSFNSLADSLLNANTRLELRVSERTAQLQELNETLEQRVEERTQALHRTNQELQAAMEELQQAQQELIRSEKMAALGGLVAGVAHEINTPLGIGITGASHLKEETDEIHGKAEAGQITRGDLDRFLSSTRTSCELMLSQLARAADLVSDFKQVAVDQSQPDIRQIELPDYLDKVVTTLQPQFKRTRLQIKVQAPPTLNLTTCPGALAQALTALLANCLTHAFEPDQPGEVVVSAIATTDGCRIELADNGKGIAAEHLSKIFDPFFTTRRGQGGSGLGLSIVHNIVTDVLRGTIHCESTPGEGSRFIMELPELKAQSMAALDRPAVAAEESS
ncbi:sensor histidine kinase [Marinobacterium arenosum]|uniref:sensor histidine kinase n=1 Tax=Marinobacterium arenosum TaxID=2862496 RepID=UPI001C95B587|nr:sensor histidine kinase [Marinobacterium arenosum]MBY4677433.1 sensor histidine kinase [Marinobacterium arenosum]